MSESAAWFVMQGDQSLGPYTGEQLVEFAQAGNVTREMLVWTEGMAEWQPAANIPGLFPEVAVQAARPVMVTTAAPSGSWTPGAGLRIQGGAPQTQPSIHAGPEYPPISVPGASFGLWLGMIIAAVVLVILGPVLAANLGQREQTQAMAAVLFLAMMGAAGILAVISSILGMMYLHRAWTCIQPGKMARCTPGKAVGFLFIPFFNLYWIFVAWKGLAEDWNRTVSSHDDLKAAPRFSEGLFLALCILTFFGLSIFAFFPVMSQLCRGINFFAFRRTKTHGGVGFSLR
ncbi:MAG: GYF domain-containing protein [Akkermansiaceae bacterium]|jgi:hypothetical protein|nr:GYF domain-containing protein [Akkermansiaceae bacterium]